MEVVESITRTTLQEIEKVLNTRTIVGDPIALDGRTVIPLISVGFAFGAGGGAGKGEGQGRREGKGEGEAGGTGGGAWVRPIAVIISDSDGVRVEPVIGGISGAMEKVGESVPRLIEKVVDKWADRRKDD
jgi:uncharacterized spore protein YtfJ